MLSVDIMCLDSWKKLLKIRQSLPKRWDNFVIYFLFEVHYFIKWSSLTIFFSLINVNSSMEKQFTLKMKLMRYAWSGLSMSSYLSRRFWLKLKLFKIICTFTFCSYCFRLFKEQLYSCILWYFCLRLFKNNWILVWSQIMIF